MKLFVHRLRRGYRPMLSGLKIILPLSASVKKTFEKFRKSRTASQILYKFLKLGSNSLDFEALCLAFANFLRLTQGSQ